MLFIFEGGSSTKLLLLALALRMRQLGTTAYDVWPTLTLPMKAGKKVLRPRTSTNFSQFADPSSPCMAYERTLIARVFASSFSLGELA